MRRILRVKFLPKSLWSPKRPNGNAAVASTPPPPLHVIHFPPLLDVRRPLLRDTRRPLRDTRRPLRDVRRPFLRVERDPPLLKFAGIPAVIEFGIPCGVMPAGTTFAGASAPGTYLLRVAADPPLILLFGIMV
jgi:hypothetical protein